MGMTRLEIGLTAGFVLCLGFIGYGQYRKAVDNAVAEQTAEILKQSQDKANQALKERDSQYQQDLHTMEEKYKSLAKMTPQQIIQKAPQYVSLPKPIIIAGPETTSVPVGSAIIPPEDVQPIAGLILDGQKCQLDLTKCKGDLGDWQQKYDLKSQESEQWEKAAKGGSWVKRLGKNALKIGIGVGIGYALRR